MITQIRKYSYTESIFFVPILAGTSTVIGPITNFVKESQQMPLRIPLPLLSHESSLAILCKAVRDSVVKGETQLSESEVSILSQDACLKHIFYYIGGHCRSLEFLYKATICKPVVNKCGLKSNAHTTWRNRLFV